MRLKRVMLSLGMVALLGSGLKADIMVYGPGGPAPVLKELAKQFEEQTKQKIQIVAGPTPSWIEKAKKDADIIFAGNSSMMDGFVKALPKQVDAQNIQVLNIRQAGIVVRPNNPKKIKKFDDVLQKGVKVMVVDGAGQVGLYEDIALRKGRQENLSALRKNIVFYAPNSKAAVEKWNGDKDIDVLIIWSHWAKTLGSENVSAALLEKYANNAAVVVSVDNGITAFCAGQWCKARGIPFIITDHHTPTDTLPQADVIINPMLQDSTFIQKSICGAVVAWYFCAAIKQNLKANIDMGMFLEYLAIATIADVMPLTGINRILVKKGLESLNHSSSVLATLLRESFARFKKPITAENLAFDFIPLLNCAGRKGNPKPTFLLENLTIQEIKPLGRAGKHFEYTLADSNGMCLVGLEFLAPTRRETGQCVDIHIELMRDYYKNCIKAKILEVFVK